MNEQKLNHYRKRLLELKANLLEARKIDVEPTRRDPSEGGDEDEAPLAEMLQVIASNRNRSRAGELARIEAALLRLSEEPDDFGLCLTCEERIAERRLEAMPYVELCVECQSTRDAPRGTKRRHLTDFS